MVMCYTSCLRYHFVCCFFLNIDMTACPQSDKTEDYEDLKSYFRNDCGLVVLLRTKYYWRNKQGMSHNNYKDHERWLWKSKCMTLSVFLHNMLSHIGWETVTASGTNCKWTGKVLTMYIGVIKEWTMHPSNSGCMQIIGRAWTSKWLLRTGYFHQQNTVQSLYRLFSLSQPL